MKQKMKILLLILLFVLVTGCKSNEEEADEARKIALQTLEERYGEEFSYVEDIESSEPCYGLVCYPKNFYVTPKNEDSPLYNQNIYVTVNKQKEVYENYIALKYYKDIEALFHNIAQKYFQNFHLDYEKFNYSDEANHFNKDTTLEDYLMDQEKRNFYVILEVPEREFQDGIPEKILEEMKSKMKKSYLLLIVSKDAYFGKSSIEDLLDETSRDDFSKIATYVKITNFEETNIEIYNQYGKVE